MNVKRKENEMREMRKRNKEILSYDRAKIMS